MSQQQNNDMQQHFYRASAADFGKIPGSPVAYWFSSNALRNCNENQKLMDYSDAKSGMSSCNSELFLRQWFEVSFSKVNPSSPSHESAKKSGSKWFLYNKGGGNRRWFGYNDTVINWHNDGGDIKRFVVNNPKDPKTTHWSRRLFNLEYFFKEGLTWSAVTSGRFSCRSVDIGVIPGTGSKTLYDLKNETLVFSLLNSTVASYYLSVFSPTLNFEAGDVGKIPVIESINLSLLETNALVDISKKDWNSFEISIGFITHPIFHSSNTVKGCLNENYQYLMSSWHSTTLEMQRLEEENNRLFIEAYGLQDELTPEVPLSEITLTCNPHYRYGGNLTDNEREARLQSDTLCELISYAIGCMMGRYSLDRDGLVYAHAGNEGFKALVDEGAYASFAADDDGILPLTSENWFSDDVAARIEAFVATVWGKEPLEENLNFIADSLTLYVVKPAKKGGETARETIRRYLSSQFYKDHLKTYKKRPIYWLFSSGKEKAFECLVYLHRYSESTLPRMRTEYVTPLLGQMASRIERKRMEQTEASTAEAKRIGKEIDSLNKQLSELRAFDDELKHHADMRIQLDLDDGVKVNYGKFGTLLSDVKAITGDKGE